MELSPEVNVGYQSFEEKKNSSLADSASQISPLTGRCFTKIIVTTVVCLSLLTLAASPVVLSVFCPGPLGTES